MSSAWQSSLGFSERLSSIVEITAAFTTTHPEVAAAEASQYARSQESRILEDSSSLADYQLRCTSLIEELEQSSASLPASADTETNEIIAARILETSLATARFGRYENAAHFGDGIFSEVFLAKASDQSLDTFSGHPGAYVALKVTYLAALIAPHNAEREARILRKASASNIIPLWESFHDGKGHLILVFPFIPFSLEQLLRDGRLSDAAKKSCLRDLFVALTHLHSLGIIHRDVKPSNILLESPSGRAYLSDFGIAWSPEDPASEEPTKKITDVGTTNYRPPELLFGYTSYDTTLDLWAAGCVVFEVVRGQNKSLFDSGDLGAELALIQSIFKTLGTPTADNWPEIAALPDWGKMQFYDYPAKSWPELMPAASISATDLVSRLVRYSGRQRLTAKLALEHAYFKDNP